MTDLTIDDPSPRAVPYAYRALDRQYALVDNRLGDFLRPALWASQSARQLYMTSLLTAVIGTGPAAIATTVVPDMHHFRGSFGAKDVIPLWRDATATSPNIAPGILELLGVAPEELFAYCYAILSGSSYTTRFADELEVPGPHIPLTRDRELFSRAVELGEQLLWLHTYCERFVPRGMRAGKIPQGSARSEVAVPTSQEGYPEGHSYDPESRKLRVGDGVFSPVAPEVRGYSVSGLDVIGSWLDYRMRGGAGRRSSQLDRIRPATWPAAFTEELLRLLWVIEATVALGPDLDDLLKNTVAGPVYRADELPQPTPESRLPPA